MTQCGNFCMLSCSFSENGWHRLLTQRVALPHSNFTKRGLISIVSSFFIPRLQQISTKSHIEVKLKKVVLLLFWIFIEIKASQRRSALPWIKGATRHKSIQQRQQINLGNGKRFEWSQNCWIKFDTEVSRESICFSTRTRRSESSDFCSFCQAVLNDKVVEVHNVLECAPLVCPESFPRESWGNTQQNTSAQDQTRSWNMPWQSLHTSKSSWGSRPLQIPLLITSLCQPCMVHNSLVPKSGASRWGEAQAPGIVHTCQSKETPPPQKLQLFLANTDSKRSSFLKTHKHSTKQGIWKSFKLHEWLSPSEEFLKWLTTVRSQVHKVQTKSFFEGTCWWSNARTVHNCKCQVYPRLSTTHQRVKPRTASRQSEKRWESCDRVPVRKIVQTVSSARMLPQFSASLQQKITQALVFILHSSFQISPNHPPRSKGPSAAPDLHTSWSKSEISSTTIFRVLQKKETRLWFCTTWNQALIQTQYPVEYVLNSHLDAQLIASYK